MDMTAAGSLRRRAISAGAWNVASVMGAQVLRLSGNLIMTRLLLPDMFGVMVIAITVSVVLHLLSDVGMRQNIIQSQNGDSPAFLNTAWTMQIIRGFILCGLTQVLAIGAWFAQQKHLWPADSTYAEPVLPLVLAITGLSAIINGLQSTKMDMAVRTLQQKRIVLIELGAQLAGLVVMLMVGYATRSIWSLVAASLVNSLVSTTLSHLVFSGPRNRLQWDRGALAELVSYGRWILLSSMVGVLAMYGDRIWFGAGMSAEELGVYAIAILILGSVQTGVLKVISAVALPAFSEATRANDHERLKQLYHRLRLLVDVPMLFMCGGLMTAGPLLIDWLYDHRYGDAGTILAILSLSLFTLRYTLAHQVWLALGLTRYQAMDNIIRLVSLWCALPLLLAVGGTTYAIWGVALHTFPTLALIVHVNRKLGIFSLRRELMVLPMLAVGALCGEALIEVVKWI